MMDSVATPCKSVAIGHVGQCDHWLRLTLWPCPAIGQSGHVNSVGGLSSPLLVQLGARGCREAEFSGGPQHIDGATPTLAAAWAQQLTQFSIAAGGTTEGIEKILKSLVAAYQGSPDTKGSGSPVQKLPSDTGGATGPGTAMAESPRIGHTASEGPGTAFVPGGTPLDQLMAGLTVAGSPLGDPATPLATPPTTPQLQPRGLGACAEGARAAAVTPAAAAALLTVLRAVLARLPARAPALHPSLRRALDALLPLWQAHASAGGAAAEAERCAGGAAAEEGAPRGAPPVDAALSARLRECAEVCAAWYAESAAFNWRWPARTRDELWRTGALPPAACSRLCVVPCAKCHAPKQ